MIKYSVGSLFLSIILTILLVMIFKEMKVYIAMGAAGFTGWLLSIWFIRTQKRLPTKKERNIIIGIYSGSIALLFILLAFSSSKTTGGGIITIAIITVVYPGFLSLLFNEKNLKQLLEKYNLKEQDA